MWNREYFKRVRRKDKVVVLLHMVNWGRQNTVSFYIPKTKRTREVRRFAKTEKPEARLGLSALARIR